MHQAYILLLTLHLTILSCTAFKSSWARIHPLTGTWPLPSQSTDQNKWILQVQRKTSFTWMLQTIQALVKDSWKNRMKVGYQIWNYRWNSYSTHADPMDTAVVMTAEPGFMKQQFQQLQTASSTGHWGWWWSFLWHHPQVCRGRGKDNGISAVLLESILKVCHVSRNLSRIYPEIRIQWLLKKSFWIKETNLSSFKRDACT